MSQDLTRQPEAPEPAVQPQPAAPPHGRGWEKRQTRRRQITGLDVLAQRTRVMFDEAGEDSVACRILDVSDDGYRIALSRPRKIKIGSEFTLEHADGWRRLVRACWVAGNQVGLHIDKSVTRVILNNEAKESLMCKILAASEDRYRITLTPARQITGEFTLELANGTRRRVRVSWAWENELGLQAVEPLKASQRKR